jgi:hypothetical protein
MGVGQRRPRQGPRLASLRVEQWRAVRGGCWHQCEGVGGMHTGVRAGHSSGLTKPLSGSVGGELGARFGKVSAVGS